MISLPPSSSGASHVHVTESFLSSSNPKFTGGPGLSIDYSKTHFRTIR